MSKMSKGLNDEIRLDTLTGSFSKMQKNTLLLCISTLFNSNLLHRRVVHNRLSHNMGVSETPNCLYSNTTETIIHV